MFSFPLAPFIRFPFFFFLDYIKSLAFFFIYLIDSPRASKQLDKKDPETVLKGD